MTDEEKIRQKLKRLVKQLKEYSGRHTELVSVYVPQGYQLIKIIQQLQDEQGTAENIKSAATRKNVVSALERMVQHLRIIKNTPPNGLAIFSGNISEREGRVDVQVWSIEPPIPINLKMYRCDKNFVTEPLEEMMESKDIYGLVVMDKREATVALLKGKRIVPLTSSTSNVAGKTRAGGQCLTKDTLVMLADGNIVEIQNVHNPVSIKSVNFENYSITDSAVKDKWAVKKKQQYIIKTKNPTITINASPDHLFFTREIIEKPASGLKKGDFLIMPEKIEVNGKTQRLIASSCFNSYSISKSGRALLCKKRKGFLQKDVAGSIKVSQTAISCIELGKRNVRNNFLGNLCKKYRLDFTEFLKKYCNPATSIKLPARLDRNLAQFLGYFIGDGSFEKERITLFESNKNVIKNYEKISKDIFNANCSLKFRKSKNYYQLRIYGKPIIKFLKLNFLAFKSNTTLIPEKILKSKDGVIEGFLKGIFDAEGYVATTRIGLGINNKGMAQQLQFLLLRFGIISSLHEYDNRANRYSDNPRYTIEISDFESISLFEKKIGFSSKTKTSKIGIILNRRSKRDTTRQILIAGSMVRELIEKAGHNLQLFPKVSSFFRDKREMGKRTFVESILKHIKDKKLHSMLVKIALTPLIPVKINEIRKITKKEELIDISVKNQNFIANGLLVHNSAHRFAQLRENAALEFYKRIAEIMKKEFLGLKDLKGILVGGPGMTKYEFIETAQITDEVKKKIIAVKDISYTDEYGLQELLEKCQDVLAKEAVTAEKEIMNRFFKMLAEEPGKVAYGEAEVRKALDFGAVEILLLSDAVDDKLSDELEEKANAAGAELKIISTDTREGVQLREMGKIAAILRYQLT